ncbi:hypothetical protein KCG48_10590 [Proteiniclasticum sp. BAD-10]|uniref:Uncharacterized protein n=1 Tax=Proteiniclasticum sediminis TaxID=2804028 RepID=A0A941CQ95_9CLOT|nr:hypothetical protein [Proteiniclasticum sediminis]MBR0576780.1 hypothetical protein [Proteiniclasticum sediminis]
MEEKLIESAKIKWTEAFYENDPETRNMLFRQIDLLRLISDYIKKYGANNFKNLIGENMSETEEKNGL